MFRTFSPGGAPFATTCVWWTVRNDCQDMVPNAAWPSPALILFGNILAITGGVRSGQKVPNKKENAGEHGPLPSPLTPDAPPLPPEPSWQGGRVSMGIESVGGWGGVQEKDGHLRGWGVPSPPSRPPPPHTHTNGRKKTDAPCVERGGAHTCPSRKGNSEGKLGGNQGEFALCFGEFAPPLPAETHCALCGGSQKASPSIPFIILEGKQHLESTTRCLFETRAL